MATQYLLIRRRYWAPFINGIGSRDACIHFEQPVLSDGKRYYLANWRMHGYQSQKH